MALDFILKFISHFFINRAETQLNGVESIYSFDFMNININNVPHFIGFP